MEKTMNLVWLMTDTAAKAAMIIFWYLIGTAIITPVYTYFGVL